MNPAGLRQAAVLLASMHPRDRRWMRRQLPAECWPHIRVLLRELRSLGHTDPGALRGALAREALEAAAPEPPTPDVLMAGLQGLEPDWIACTLAACAPDHVELYMASHPTVDGLAVREALPVAAVPPKLALALARAVSSRGERMLAGLLA